MTAETPLTPRIEIDGASATADQLRTAAVSGYGHFTAMQVRGGRVRGLGLHLARLDAANRELFGTGLDGAAVVAHIRHAIAQDISGGASVRVIVHEGAAAPAVMVTVRPPATMPGRPWTLRSAPYQRSLAHIKHAGDFGQRYYQRIAHASGFDEALLTGPDGIISEGSVTNVGFFDGTTVIWPAAPALSGITMQLLEPALADRGIPSRRAHVRADDLTFFRGVFVTNARGIAAVERVDGTGLPVDVDLMRELTAAYESVPWDSL